MIATSIEPRRTSVAVDGDHVFPMLAPTNIRMANSTNKKISGKSYGVGSPDPNTVLSRELRAPAFGFQRILEQSEEPLDAVGLRVVAHDANTPDLSGKRAESAAHLDADVYQA